MTGATLPLRADARVCPAWRPSVGTVLRAAIALAIGLNVAQLAMATKQSAGHVTYTDFEFYWRAVRLWSDGIDPYLMRPNESPRLWPLRDRLFYPLPALMLTSPLHLASLQAAVGLFTGLSAAWLAWVRTSTGEWWRLLIFVTPMFLMAVTTGQWSPLLTVGALVPTAGFLLASKPTLGLACFAYRPTWRGAVSVLAIGLVSLALWPTWPLEWLDNLRSVRHHPAPLVTPFGWLLALAVLRWRQPEGRLVVAMACVPQLLGFADQLPLALVARNRREAGFLSAVGCVVWLCWRLNDQYGPGTLPPGDYYVMLGCYLPALYLVLRRPNEGPAPAWLERRIARWPTALRGLET